MDQPSPQDVADTMTATLRTLKEQTAVLNSFFSITWIMFGLVSICTGVATFYLLRKLVTEWH